LKVFGEHFNKRVDVVFVVVLVYYIVIGCVV